MPEHRTFLLVEDSPDDALLLRRCFIKARLLNQLQVVRTAEEAIAYLSGMGKYANRSRYPLPGVVLLDLQLPGVNGFEVLKWVRSDPSRRGLRVVVLTASDNMRDVQNAYELGANSFLIKPADFDRFAEFSQALGGYWTWSDSPTDAAPAGSAAEPEAREVRRANN